MVSVVLSHWGWPQRLCPPIPVQSHAGSLAGLQRKKAIRNITDGAEKGLLQIKRGWRLHHIPYLDWELIIPGRVAWALIIPCYNDVVYKMCEKLVQDVFWDRNKTKTYQIQVPATRYLEFTSRIHYDLLDCYWSLQNSCCLVSLSYISYFL